MRWLVVVRDDGVDTRFCELGDGLGGGRAIVHADDELGAGGLGLLHGVVTEGVPIGESVGDVPCDGGSEVFKQANEEGGARHAVHVVVAVHQDGLALINGLHDAIRGRGH